MNHDQKTTKIFTILLGKRIIIILHKSHRHELGLVHWRWSSSSFFCCCCDYYSKPKPKTKKKIREEAWNQKKTCFYFYFIIMNHTDSHTYINIKPKMWKATTKKNKFRFFLLVAYFSISSYNIDFGHVFFYSSCLSSTGCCRHHHL